uniref:Phosphatidylcholine transfer protein n=1 Tax=Plectus sambesii TaxID=2011161 RepID=A0A914VWG0_9BILA
MLSGLQQKLASVVFRPFSTDWSRMRQLGRLCLRQCNSHASIRLRRYCQLVNLYQQLYNESSLRGLFAHFDRTLWRRFRGRWREGFLMAAATFSFQANGINDEEMARAADMICDFDRDPQASSAGQDDRSKEDSGEATWEMVMNEPNFRVWKRPLPDHSQLYEYKCAGTYHDIPAAAFFMAQLDLDYRRQWDEQVITLDVIDSDDATGTEVVRWITHYPYPMYPREYIYVRRACVDSCRKLMTLSSHATEHPGFPASKKHIRVDVYSSNMVIRPHSDFDQLGMDYVLTYSDDPKAALPSTAYKWMVKYGVPRFVQQIHDAAKTLYEKMGNRLVAESSD